MSARTPKFIYMKAHVLQEDGSFLLHLYFYDRRQQEFEMSDELEFPSLEEATAQVMSIADEFQIARKDISFSVEMENYRDQTVH